MVDFKVGDRVRYTGKKGYPYSTSSYVGVTGIVTEAFEPRNIKVTWDKSTSGPSIGVYPENIELIEDTPKSPSGPFYVYAVSPLSAFDSVEAAEAHLKIKAQANPSTTYGIFSGVKAMKVSSEVQEVPFGN